MKVVVVDPWHFTPPYDQELCKGLVKAGHQVTFVKSADNADDTPEDRPGFTTVEIFSAPPRSLPRALELAAKGCQHILGMIRLLAVLRRLNPDVIHFQWLSLPLVDALFLRLFRRIAPLILTVHDSNPYNGAGPWLLRAGSKIAMQGCDRFIVHNSISEKRLIGQGLAADRIQQIAHGLLDQPPSERRRPAGRTDKRIHFLQFGKVKAYKGTDILLTALSVLRSEDREKCRVSIVGRPYIDTQPLANLVASHDLDELVDLRFDFISDVEMATLFDSTDFLVFPYREIDTSGVLMVAAAHGIPVIASDIGCFAEILHHEEEAILVPPGDPEKLAEAMTALISAPEKQALMAVKMKALRERIPSWSAIAKATTIVYEHAQMEAASQPAGAHS
jgi:glycosyltransferase involved in cell wall biosynthesis